MGYSNILASDIPLYQNSGNTQGQLRFLEKGEEKPPWKGASG